MSNRKRNVAFIKPQDPSFLQKIKAQIGYKEGPDIDAKRQKLENDRNDSSDEEFERDEEKPQVVVLEKGDLTAEEVAEAEKAEREKPADLNQRVIFKSKQKIVDNTTIKENKKLKKKRSAESKNKLSFKDIDEEEIF